MKTSFSFSQIKERLRPKTDIQKLIVTIGLYFIAWQLCLTLLGFFASGVIVPQVSTTHTGPGVFIEHTARWDSGWYAGIAADNLYEKKPQSAVFYPLFPILIHYVAEFFSVGVVAASFIITSVATLMAFIFLGLIGLEYTHKRRRAFNIVLLFSLFPTAFFLHSMYTESLLCALGFSAFYFALKSKWWLVGILLSLCLITRIPSVLFALLCLLEYFRQAKWSIRNIRFSILWFSIVPVCFLIFSSYLHAKHGSYTHMFEAYKMGPEWRFQRFHPNELKTIYEVGLANINILQVRDEDWITRFFYQAPSLILWLSALFVGIYSLVKRQLSVPLGIFIVVACLFLAQNGNFISVSRYLLPVFPLFIWLESRFQSKPELFGVYLGLSGAFLGLCLTIFSVGKWVA